MPSDVEHVTHALLVIPARGKFSLVRRADTVAVPASGLVAVQYVHPAFGADLNLVWGWAVRRVHRIPAGMIRIDRGVVVVSTAAIGGPERLVALLAGPRFRRLGAGRGRVGDRSAGSTALFSPGEFRRDVAIRPV